MSGHGENAAVDEETLLFVKGDKIEVKSEKIEAEISRLWRKAALSGGGQSKHVVTRACLWNLIVRTQSADALVYAKKLVDEIAPSVPARVLLLHRDADDSDALRAFIETNWMRAGGAEATGSDEITLVAGGKAAGRLPSLARALLSPDAPSAMLWIGPPPQLDHEGDGDPVVLLDEVDRLIIDTRKGSESDMAAFARLAAAKPELEIVDLAWLGLYPWRTILASLFDPPFDPRALGEVNHVQVATEVIGAQSSGLSLLGWLASRLGWKNFLVEHSDDPKTKRRMVAATRAGRAVHLELGSRTQDDPRGLSSIVLRAGDRRWSLDRQKGSIAVAAPGLPERAQPKRSRSDSELAIVALGPRGRDPVFREALASAAELISVLQKSGDIR